MGVHRVWETLDLTQFEMGQGFRDRSIAERNQPPSFLPPWCAVNNVGTNIRKKTTEYTPEDLGALLQTNLASAFHLSQLAHPLLAAPGGGVVLFNSSVAGGPTALRCVLAQRV